jgi:hypothetical protein
MNIACRSNEWQTGTSFRFSRQCRQAKTHPLLAGLCALGFDGYGIIFKSR